MAKFKVDDWVTILSPPDVKEEASKIVKAHILEVHTQTCEANVTQVRYSARIWFWKDGQFVLNEVRFREMELGEKITSV